ncbi:DUF922 domain-containing protein [Chryseobacterium paridis]|uniref:DUF922 domain-containing protein n=1 Tax=Chryseobacterium paridis TaxID=2800328 RepID=A0ABS1FVF1_9FLAO|nr:DUF922 domain-containing protein [Chryseobacterium paridis]MBK1896323.1 DUF922 domain-containing protein [Chryseobacterium paridis]
MKWSIVCLLISAQLWSQKIIWDDQRKLEWSNFQSKVNAMKNPDVVAYTHCGWEYSTVVSSDPSVPVKIMINTIFREDKSWKDVKRINDYALLHEQKHFDIAEIFARKLRKEVSENIKTSSDYQKKFKDIYSKISNEYKAFQTAYDKDTQNGMNKEKQAQYNTIIAEALENLNSYKKS